MRAAGLICLVLATLLACAETAPPPGGPADKTPAALLSVSPESLATLVAADAPLRFEFSEKLDRASVRRSIRTIPVVELERPRFDDLFVELRPVGSWPDSQVIVWSLEPTLKDKHGVALPKAISGAFTRAGELPAGAIEGSASWDESKGGEAQAVASLLREPPEGERRRQLWRRAYLGADRRFRIELLEPGDGPFRLELYLDRNGNGARDERELTARLDSLFLPDSLLTLDVGLLVLLDLEGPVDTWFCSTPPQDSVKVIVYAVPLLEGDARTAALDSTGCSRALPLTPGQVRVGLFRDLNGDGRFGLDSLGISEPFVESVELEIVAARPDTMSLDAAWERRSWAELDSLTTTPPRSLWKGEEP